MAITVTTSGDWQSVEGPRRKSRVTIAFDSSYVAGGESLTAAMIGLRVIEKLEAMPANGYTFEYDHTNSLLKAYQGQSEGIIQVSTTVSSNTAVGETPLFTYSLPASTLSVNNSGLEIYTWGRIAAAAENKMALTYFGSSVVASSNSWGSVGGTNAGGWFQRSTILRTGATTQTAVGFSSMAKQGSVVTANDHTIRIVTPAETLSGAITIKVTASSTTVSGMFFDGIVIRKIAAPGTGTYGAEVPTGADLSGLTGVRVEAVGY